VPLDPAYKAGLAGHLPVKEIIAFVLVSNIQSNCAVPKVFRGSVIQERRPSLFVWLLRSGRETGLREL
jgi:hypothetical protein